MDIQEEADNIANHTQEIQELQHIVELQRSVIQQKEQIILVMNMQAQALVKKLMEFYAAYPEETFSEENNALLKASITRILALGDQSQAAIEELAALETQ